VGTHLEAVRLEFLDAVGIADFLALLEAWGSCSDCGTCPADFDGDCSVGILDLLILLGNWA